MVFIQEIIYLEKRMGHINLDEYKSIGTHQIALHVNAKSATYFDSFVFKPIPKESRKFMGNKNITINI